MSAFIKAIDEDRSPISSGSSQKADKEEPLYEYSSSISDVEPTMSLKITGNNVQQISTSNNVFIDKEEIQEGCNLLNEAAYRLRKIRDKVLEAETYCSRDSLKIDDQNVEYYLDECASYFSKIADFVDDFSDNVMRDTTLTIENLSPEGY